MSRRFRNFVFTLNNPTFAEREAFIACAFNMPRGLSYIVYQEEIGQNGTPHFQGYAELPLRRTLISVKKRYPMLARAHIEARRGSQQQAIAYSQKAETRDPHGQWGEHGEKKNQGGQGKSKYREIAIAINEGETLDNLNDQYPGLFLLSEGKISDYYINNKGKRNWAMQIEILHGKTGTGKSYTANNAYPDAYVAPWPTGGRWWWPHYKGEEVVIMDEFRHQIKMDTMLKLFDRYPWIIERKGGNMNFCSKKIVITTNIDPKDWYGGLSKEVREPLRRRIQEYAKIYDFHDNKCWPNFDKTMRTEPFVFNEKKDENCVPRFDFRKAEGTWDAYSN